MDFSVDFRGKMFTTYQGGSFILDHFLWINFYPIDELKSISHSLSNENILGIWRE